MQANKSCDTYGSVGLAALRLGIFLQALGLVTHGAFDFDNLLSGAVHAIDCGWLATVMVNLIAKVSELLDRVLGRREVFVAAAALDLWRNRDASEPVKDE
jgi:uncharacterized protein involved in response to NO